MDYNDFLKLLDENDQMDEGYDTAEDDVDKRNVKGWYAQIHQEMEQHAKRHLW